MMICEDRGPPLEHIRRYSGSVTFELIAIIPNAEHRIVGRRDVILRQREDLNSNANEVLAVVLVTTRSYDTLSIVLLLSFAQNG